jgi:hypothetical protein
LKRTLIREICNHECLLVLIFVDHINNMIYSEVSAALKWNFFIDSIDWRTCYF